jgi:cytochrome c2
MNRDAPRSLRSLGRPTLRIDRRTTLAAVVALAVLALVTPALAQPLASPLQEPSFGARVFDDKGCARCHAVETAAGKSGKIGPNLALVSRARTFFDLGAALWNHAPRMAARMREAGIARPRLEADEAAHLAAYLGTLDYFDRRGRPAVGQRLFGEKRCAACHAAGGPGPALDRPATAASPISLAAALWNHGPQMAESMKRHGIERPTFKAGELIDLIAYLNRNAPATAALYVLPGRVDAGLSVFTEARCVECHSIGGPAKPGVVDLVERAGRKSVTEFAAAMWNKAPAMQAALAGRGMTVPNVSAQGMADVVALLYSAQYFSRSGSPSRGVAVATAKGCLDCHALHGERGKPAGDLVTATGLESAAGILASLWNHGFIDEPRPSDARTTVKTMSAADMADVVAWLRSLRRSRP